MQRHHTGSGRATVIPPDWAAHHRLAALGTMTATVEIRHVSAPGALNRETGKRTSEAQAAHYTGGARLQALPAVSGERESGEQQLTVAGYLVTVELNASAASKVGDIIKVTDVDSNGDPALVGRELRVTGEGPGSLAWERDLAAALDLG